MLTHMLHGFLSIIVYTILSAASRRFFLRDRLRRFRQRLHAHLDSARSTGFAAGYEAGRRDCLKELEQGKVYR